ncbi:aminotransferase class I/II-fold pyridoxal phosphate-dependent enzyme [Paroceanicella profunda]|uniref:Aminotransferase class I/II-fold pyridoxal phosphate-dependent enzyme n=1 Tax=Paroceanicella profunda TaxID=2579971 RepID=A0A5B8FGR4_9RHOB|nr:aminotransferase class I/II-fold pyridoxal phosphate-dependent enzyme [Paroceanicella profunda]QDL91551.1 aminotransferase class I/II-fold pyridoxal phosphate-dependent enzyme [Paroceanicella profunda]
MAENPLLDSLRQARSARRQRRQDHPSEAPLDDAPVTRPAHGFDFTGLPAFKQMRLQQAAAELIGIDSPFFRVHAHEDASRTLIGNMRCINFASYNYLGLNDHPEVRAAATEAVDRYGISAGASRLVGGEHAYHRPLEEDIATALGTEDALCFVSGHATNVSTISTMMGPKDLVLVDSLIHNSISEGVRLSGAQRMSFPHNDFAWIDETLRRVRRQFDRVLIVVEGLYSMDGDFPDLPRFVEVKTRHDAWLMVDEAHSLGVLGATGRGIAEHQNVDPATVEIWMGTMSKTLSSCGGYIAGSKALIDILRYSAPGFVFSVGLAAPLAAAARKSLEIMLREPERVARLAENGKRFRTRAREAGLDTGLSEGYAVTPVIIGDSLRTAFAADDVLRAGVNALPIIAPAVPDKQARLRFFLTSEHTAHQIDEAVAKTAEAVIARQDEDLMARLRS